jgi:hypothetical protein
MPTDNLKFQPPKGFVVSRVALSSWQTCLRDVKTLHREFDGEGFWHVVDL